MVNTLRRWVAPACSTGLRRLGAAAIDLLLPPRCMACAEPVLDHDTLCTACFRATTLINSPCCDRCGLPFQHDGQGLPAAEGEGLACAQCLVRPPDYGRARAALLYDEGSRRLILPLKYGDRTELAGLLARQMVRAGRELLAEAELILPVPLHRSRLLTRRYNQAALLARRLSRLSGRPWAPDLLLRARRTPPLADFGAAQRALVLEGAFTLSAGAARRIEGRRLLLVDDVLTSGATVGGCTRLLLAAGAASVDVLAASRTAASRAAGQ
ncbi:ComF family protein [Pseudoroseomonas sp. WGS1072]|uniref:ComF family protein n=1 Tax=Roseomonas sp. WGS1072 TaxID=3366816 RepID=UPI003BEFCA40